MTHERPNRAGLLALSLALVLSVSLPAGAQMTQSGRNGATGAAGASAGAVSGDLVEGIVTSILPTAGIAPGTIVTLLGGLIQVDLSQAVVKRVGPDGSAASGPVQPGDRLAAVLKDPATTSGRLVATTAFVHTEAEGAILHGDLTSVDAPGSSFVLFGLKVKTTSSTVFGGDGVKSLADLKAGDPVVAVLVAGTSGLEAVRVLKTAPVPTPGERLHGKVMVIGTTSWTIAPTSTTPSIPEVIVEVNADTKILGDPKVGDEVDVLGKRDSAGRLVALLIVKTPAAVAPVQKVHGWVASIGAASWTIATGPAGSAAPVLLLNVNSATKIVGDPKVGDEVEVLATNPATGGATALLIVKINVSAGPGGGSGGGMGGGTIPGLPPVSFDGVVKAIAGVQWTVADTKVIVTPLTKVVGLPKAGDNVHVEGLKMPDASVVATLLQRI